MDCEASDCSSWEEENNVVITTSMTYLMMMMMVKNYDLVYADKEDLSVCLSVWWLKDSL